jgi:hypothetical protein
MTYPCGPARTAARDGVILRGRKHPWSRPDRIGRRPGPHVTRAAAARRDPPVGSTRPSIRVRRPGEIGGGPRARDRRADRTPHAPETRSAGGAWPGPDRRVPLTLPPPAGGGVGPLPLPQAGEGLGGGRAACRSLPKTAGLSPAYSGPRCADRRKAVHRRKLQPLSRGTGEGGARPGGSRGGRVRVLGNSRRPTQRRRAGPRGPAPRSLPVPVGIRSPCRRPGPGPRASSRAAGPPSPRW